MKLILLNRLILKQKQHVKLELMVNVEIVVVLKYLSSSWRALEMSLINWKTNLILTWSDNCVILSTVNANQGATFSITDTKLYVPVVTLPTEDNTII